MKKLLCMIALSLAAICVFAACETGRDGMDGMPGKNGQNGKSGDRNGVRFWQTEIGSAGGVGGSRTQRAADPSRLRWKERSNGKDRNDFGSLNRIARRDRRVYR